MMKQKSTMWRVLALLLVAFLWGGNARTFAEKIPWAKLDMTAKTFTLYYTEKETLGSDEYDLNKRSDWGYPLYLSSFDGQPNVEKAIFDKSFAEYRPKDLEYFFYRFYNLKDIEGLEYLNTSEVTFMGHMFYECENLTFLDLSNFDTSKVKDMSWMFCGCSKLATILASDKFVTSNLDYDAYEGNPYIFKKCNSLVGKSYQGEVPFNSDYVDNTYAKCDGGYFTNATRPYATLTDGTLTFNYGFKKKLSDNDFLLNNKLESTPEWLSKSSSIKYVKFDESFAVAQPYYCCNWFKDCQNLETVEGVENFDASQVKTMEQMFYGCTSLKTLDLSNLDVSKVTNMRGMFYDCKSLTELDLTGLNTANVIYTRAMFSGCSNLASIYVSDDKFNLDNVTSSNNMFAGCKSLRGDIPFDASSATDKTYAKVGGGYLSDYNYIRPWAKLVDGTLTFRYHSKKQLDDGEYALPDDWVTPSWSSVASSITKVSFDESFNEARPTSCYEWFAKASNLTEIENMNYFNTSEVTNMRRMFYGCSSLPTVSFYYSSPKITDTEGMFKDCSALTSLDMRRLSSLNNTNMKEMFCTCSSLKSIALNRFITSNVTNMDWMFYGCSSLESLNLVSFNTANVTTMMEMFNGCSSLQSLDLSKFNTSKVQYMTGMFRDCSALKQVDLSSFDTWQCGAFKSMFNGCSNLRTIYTSDKFAFNPSFTDIASTDMFAGCTNLRGDMAWNKINPTDKRYARALNGYFTDKQYTRPWMAYADGTLTFYYGYKKTFGANEYALTGKPADNEDVLALMPQVKKVVFDRYFNLYRPTSLNSWFKGASKLTSVEDEYYIDATDLTDVGNMFEGCSSLGSLCPNLKASNVTNMAGMFKDCTSLRLLQLFSLNTSKVTDMHDMFSGCPELRTICVNDKFVTTNVANSDNMFLGCTKLKGAIAFDETAVDKTYAKTDGGYFSAPNDVKGWVKFDNWKLTFQYGYKPSLGENEYWLNSDNETPGWAWRIGSIDNVVFDPSFADARPTSCYFWFSGGTYIKEIEGLEYLNTSRVTNMQNMFYYCFAYKSGNGSIDLSHFNTERVKNMNNMFYSCDVDDLDLSSFNTSAVTDMDVMLGGLSKYTNVYLGENFVLSSNASNIFNEYTHVPVIYVAPSRYKELAARDEFAGRTVKPYVNINANAPYGTLCVPVGGTLADGGFSGFDKLYQVKDADKDKGTITLEEATAIEPGVPYVYRRNLPAKATKSIISFTADDAVESVSAPKNDGSLLKGTFKRINAPEGSYILLTDGNFHPVAAGNVNPVGAYRAYLDLRDESGSVSTAAQTYRMVFVDGEVTGIDHIDTDNGIVDNADQQPKVIYDLMGRRVTSPQKGNIYIVNGKKMTY